MHYCFYVQSTAVQLLFVHVQYDIFFDLYTWNKMLFLILFSFILF